MLEQRLVGCKRAFDSKRLFFEERKSEIFDALAGFGAAKSVNEASAAPVQIQHRKICSLTRPLFIRSPCSRDSSRMFSS